MPGTYALILKSKVDQQVRIGSLGLLSVRPGFFVYVGSAFGPGGLAARVSRHQRPEKTRRSHIDYLRTATELITVWYTWDDRRRECQWADVLRQIDSAVLPMFGFGSSDCSCSSHMVYFAVEPSFRSFGRWLRKLAPDHGPIRQMALRDDPMSLPKPQRAGSQAKKIRRARPA